MALLKSEKLKDALEKLKESSAVARKGNKKKREDFAFKAGHQWTQEEKDNLESANPPRPAYVWNMIEPCVNLAVGTIIQNPVRVFPQPREISDQLLCDVLGEIVEFVDDRMGAETEEIEAFDDSATCGVGYIEVDVVADPERPLEILMFETEIPFSEISVDPASKRDDWKDARWLFREKWLSVEDFKITYPKHASHIKEIMKTGKVFTFLDDIDVPDIDGIVVDDPPASDYDRAAELDFYNIDKKLIRVMRMQYWESYQRYYGLNPTNGEVEEFPKDKLEALKERIPNFDYTKIWDKKVKWLEFTGDEILYDDDSPIPVDGFSIVPMFWSKDKSKEFVDHYGVVRSLKDPNREVNKRWCQALNALVSQGQGVMAEVDAFADVRQADASWADPTQITWMKEGAIRQEKVREKPALVFPDAAMKMEALAREAIKTISGLNPNLMGEIGSRQESGVVIRLRIQQGLILLARAFANFKKMRFEIYRRKLAIIMQYMPESQLLRILGGNEKYTIRDGIIYDMKRGTSAPLRNVKDLKYNVKIEDAPGNITKTMAELAIFLEMMKSGFPVNPETVIEKLDLSAADKADWKEFIKQSKEEQKQALQMESQQKAAEQQIKGQIEQAKLTIEAKEGQDKIRVEQAKLIVKEKENQQDFVVSLAKLNQAEKLVAKKMMAEFVKQGMTQAAGMAKDQQGFLAQQQRPTQRQMPMPMQQKGGIT